MNDTEHEVGDLVKKYEPRPPTVDAIYYDGSEAALHALIHACVERGLRLSQDMARLILSIESDGPKPRRVDVRMGTWVVFEWNANNVRVDAAAFSVDDFERLYMPAHS